MLYHNLFFFFFTKKPILKLYTPKSYLYSMSFIIFHSDDLSFTFLSPRWHVGNRLRLWCIYVQRISERGPAWNLPFNFNKRNFFFFFASSWKKSVTGEEERRKKQNGVGVSEEIFGERRRRRWRQEQIDDGGDAYEILWTLYHARPSRWPQRTWPRHLLYESPSPFTGKW